MCFPCSWMLPFLFFLLLFSFPVFPAVHRCHALLTQNSQTLLDISRSHGHFEVPVYIDWFYTNIELQLNDPTLHRVCKLIPGSSWSWQHEWCKTAQAKRLCWSTPATQTVASQHAASGKQTGWDKNWDYFAVRTESLRSNFHQTPRQPVIYRLTPYTQTTGPQPQPPVSPKRRVCACLSTTHGAETYRLNACFSTIVEVSLLTSRVFLLGHKGFVGIRELDRLGPALG